MPSFSAVARLSLIASATLGVSACPGAEAPERSKEPAADVAANASASAVEEPGPGARYGCAESIPRFVNGSYEYESQGRGYFTLHGGGRYTDPFGTDGRYRKSAAGDTTWFEGGALDRGNATPMESGRLWIVIPTESGERRWACSPMDA